MPRRTNQSEVGKSKLACDWSTRFLRVISLGLSSVNRFCSTDWDTAKCVKVVYKSVHVCNSCLVNQDFLRRNIVQSEYRC